MFSQMLYTTIIISSLPAGMVKNHVDWKFLSVSHVSVSYCSDCTLGTVTVLIDLE